MSKIRRMEHLDVEETGNKLASGLKFLSSSEDSVSPLVNEHDIFSRLQSQPADIPSQTIIPAPEFCVKIRAEDGKKVFINICTSDKVPSPQEVSEEELVKLMQAEEGVVNFRVPMSVGFPHTENDKEGNPCVAYEMVINPSFCEKANSSDVFYNFLLSVATEAIENKFHMTLKREWIRLKNKKSHGSLQNHHIRTNTKPIISEMETSEKESKPKTKAVVPEYVIIQDPEEGHPEFFIAEIQLPKVLSATSLILDVGEDRLRLDTRSAVYFLDIYFPCFIIQEDVVAEFDKSTKVLTITMPVQPAT